MRTTAGQALSENERYAQLREMLTARKQLFSGIMTHFRKKLGRPGAKDLLLGCDNIFLETRMKTNGRPKGVCLLGVHIF